MRMIPISDFWNKKNPCSYNHPNRSEAGMEDSDLVAFAPVPVRFGRDGWTPRRQYFSFCCWPAVPAGARSGLRRMPAAKTDSKPGPGRSGKGGAGTIPAQDRRVAGCRHGCRCCSIF